MITFVQKGDFNNTFKFFEKAKEIVNLGVFDKYGRMGVEALSSNSPKDTGLLSESWTYSIEHYKNGSRIVWSNNDVEHGRNVAILVQYGHATKNGTFVNGIDFINPAMKPIFERIADELWKEVDNS